MRRALLACLAVAAMLVADTIPDRQPDRRPPPDLVRGVALGLFGEDPGWSYEPLLAEIAALGATHVSLVVPWYQRDVRATDIGLHTRFSPPDDTTVRTIRQAHRLGLRVLLFPIVRLEAQASPDEWRGTLRPADRDAWFASYGARLLALAEMARREGVAALSLGSELSTLDVEPAPWAALAAQVRRRFPGRLIYSGNWDHYRDVGIWHMVDEIGLCGYFNLTASARDPEIGTLVASWQRLRRELEAYAGARGKRLLFTEVGYLSQDGTNAWPWNEGAAEPIDLEEQRRCTEAFVRAWDGAAALAGVYFWNWYGWGGSTSRGYTPRGKPAALEIARWFGGRAARLAQAPDPRDRE